MASGSLPQTAAQINAPQTGESHFIPRAEPGWSAPHNAKPQVAAWVPVDKELPDDELTVLLALSDGEVWTGFHEAGKWYHESGDRLTGVVTHWMQFPEPPSRDISKATAAEIVGMNALSVKS
jgi:hypothetical protein